VTGTEGLTDTEPVAAASEADELDALIGTWWTIPEVAEALGIDVVRVRQLLRDGQLLALRGGERNVLRIPADFIQYGRVLKGLPGTLTVLADSGYSPEERFVWLFTADDTLPGTPVQALRENRGTEVRRRAQASAF
jgi:hypothetical protein